eukprot:scaffold631_cov49-Cyclotella_meneghiniana.AAC.7
MAGIENGLGAIGLLRGDGAEGSGKGRVNGTCLACERPIVLIPKSSTTRLKVMGRHLCLQRPGVY